MLSWCWVICLKILGIPIKCLFESQDARGMLGKSCLSTKAPWWIDIPMGVTRHLQISPKIRDLKLWECLNRPNVSITFHCSRAMNESGHSIPTKAFGNGPITRFTCARLISHPSDPLSHCENFPPRSYAWTWPKTFNIIGLLLQVRTPGEAKWPGLGG